MIIMAEIRRHLEERGITQTEFARLVGVDKATMCKWLNDIGPLPNLKYVNRMCEILGIEIVIKKEVNDI